MNIKCEIYSPRWGHDDTYKFNFTKDKLIIKMLVKECSLIWRDELEPEWQGDDLYEVLENCFIYPPEMLRDCISHVWQSWRQNGAEALSDDEAKNELNLLIEWLNIITKSKPQSDFWKKYWG